MYLFAAFVTVGNEDHAGGVQEFEWVEPGDLEGTASGCSELLSE